MSSVFRLSKQRRVFNFYEIVERFFTVSSEFIKKTSFFTVYNFTEIKISETFMKIQSTVITVQTLDDAVSKSIFPQKLGEKRAYELKINAILSPHSLRCLRLIYKSSHSNETNETLTDRRIERNGMLWFSGLACLKRSSQNVIP